MSLEAKLGQFPINTVEEPEVSQESIMVENDFESIQDLAGGEHGGAKFVKIEKDGNAIFKKYDQHIDWEREDFINRERAAYLMSQALNFKFVPLTVIKKDVAEAKTYNVGSLQEFVPDAKCLSELTPEEIDILPKEEKARLAAFDIIINNSDRNGGNVLVKDGKLIAIDHGVSLDNFRYSEVKHVGVYHDDTRKWIADLHRNPIPAEVMAPITELANNITEQENLLKQLTELLGERGAKGYVNRIKAFAESINENSSLDQEEFRKNIDKYYKQE